MRVFFRSLPAFLLEAILRERRSWTGLINLFISLALIVLLGAYLLEVSPLVRLLADLLGHPFEPPAISILMLLVVFTFASFVFSLRQVS